MSTKNDSKKKNTSDNYIVCTYSVDPNALDTFEAKVSEIEKYARKNKLRMPKKSHLVSYLFKNSKPLKPAEFFSANQ